MLDPRIIIGVVVTYVVIMFLIAAFVERKAAAGGSSVLDNGIVYSLSLALYCTAWTFYGNIGLAVSNSFLFLAVYLGATLAILLWWYTVRIFITKRNEFGLTSIADFISYRYNKSQTVGVIATMIAIVGIMPYIALQLEGILSSFSILVGSHTSASAATNALFNGLILFIIILFTIVFGMRNLSLTERHPSMIMIVAVQSVVKLMAYLTAGIFITYFLYHGVGDIFAQVSANPDLLALERSHQPSFSMWFSYLIISMSAIMFLPRQFHVTVIENTDKKYLRTAIWMLPLFLLLITFFVMPIAFAGLLHGLPTTKGDYFMPLLILGEQKPWLALFVFIGGFAAASSMVMVETLAMTSMATNYLVLPVIEKMKVFGFSRKYILQIRWIIATGIILVSYWLKTKLGGAYILIKIGTISFCAALQFAPSMLGAIFWKRGNRYGASAGMLAGFSIWAYSSLLPAFVKSGLVPTAILDNGPFGIGFLRPEHLFGLQLDALSNVVLFSLLFNIGFYVLGSLFFKQTEEGQRIAESFTGVQILTKNADIPLSESSEKEYINLDEKKSIILEIFKRYLNPEEAEALLNKNIEQAGVQDKRLISLKNLADLYNSVEKTLSSYTGASIARDVLQANALISPKESSDLSLYYGRIISELKLSPRELSEKLNYSEEKQQLLSKQSEELEKSVELRTSELQEKVAELERFQKLTVGRELKMIELKNRIRELEGKSDETDM